MNFVNDKEPIISYSVLGAAVAALLLALLERYAPDLGQPLIQAIVALVPMVVALLVARSKAYSQNTVDSQYTKKI